ncbi:PepSY-associated TM helix domain-containing protein [Pseudoalteromonas sp. MMG005]|uniref:PepSY-associated TM helix domain-containing protein n=1 Tax=Pseudoalteromonas sp. MMG005 TaxID=2822682 RepID=UPI001B3A7417|nr:PepSY-associated TM helix domain-containing protein [Pseudoalteromonas sp. MMG005]MBQ4848312.1 PepSY domain-containing protein [Pseudoalteromonas sp. MMG005]
MTKRQLYKLHSWVGLLCLLPFLLICLTGSLLVFKTEIDRILLPEETVVFASEERMLEDDLLIAVRQQLPEYELGSWELLGNNGEADRIYLIKKGTNIWFKAHLNPYTGKVLSTPEHLHHYLTDWLVELHYTLLLNDIDGFDEHLGTAFTSIFALFLIFLGISGLVIYRQFWKRVLTLRWDQRLLVVLSDIHKIVGTLSSPVLLILGVTGGYYNISIYIHEWQEHQQRPEHHIMQKRLYVDDVSITEMVVTAPDYVAGFKTTYILFPTEPNQNITLFGQVPTSNPLLSDYGSMVTFDSQTGQYLSRYDIREQGFVTVMIDTFRKLHFGNFAGLASKIIYSIVGLAPILLGITGLCLWYSRRRKRIKQRTKTKLASLYS